MSSYGTLSKFTGSASSGKRKRTIPYYPGPSKKAKSVKIVSIPRPRFASRAVTSTFPKTKRVTLKYVEYFQNVPSVAGGAAGVTFRLNSLNDPNQSGVGHQPMGTDQWAAFYQKYTVISSKISATFMSIEALVKGGVCGISVFNGSTPLPSTTDIVALSEDDDGVHSYYPHDGTPITVSKNVSMAKYFNISNPADDDTCQSNFGGNPSRQMQAYVWTAVAPGTITIGGLVSFKVVISYDVILSEPKDLPIS